MTIGWILFIIFMAFVGGFFCAALVNAAHVADERIEYMEWIREQKREQI